MNLKNIVKFVVDRVGFEPTTSAMPMPYPTRLDDRPLNRIFSNDFNTLIFVTCILACILNCINMVLDFFIKP
jgi:hypothetical protein